MDKNKFTQAFNKLTNRRKEVLLKLLAGERDMEIASSLHIAESTVRKHIQEICENFGLKNELGERYPKRKDLIELFLQYLPELVKKSDSINSQIQQQITSQNLKKQHQDWGEAPEVPHFCGRTEEIEILKHGIVTDKAKLVALLGMGGIGKTALVTKIAQEIQDKFDWLIWRSLREAPSIQNILADLIFFISQEQEIDLPDTVGGRITKLLEYLSYSRCLIILDNAESIFQAGTYTGNYCQGYEGYGELFKQIGIGKHQSCLIITSREKPSEIAHLEGDTLPVRTLTLAGINTEYQQIFNNKCLLISSEEAQNLIYLYQGNPQALNIVSSRIQELYSGNVSEFFAEEQPVFGDIRQLLAEQFNRLSESEKQIMYWLAINRELVSIPELKDDMVLKHYQTTITDNLESLKRRSLIEKGKNENRYTLQNVIMEFITENLIKKVYEEVINGNHDLLNSHALIKAQSKDYIREIQIRLILEPLIEKLRYQFKGTKNLENKLQEIIINCQKQSPLSPGYLGGNILNIFCYLKTDLTNYDFSYLTICQAYLQGVHLHQTNFAYSDLSKSVFSKSLAGVLAVAFSPDGKFWATGDTDKNLYIWRLADSQIITTCIGHTNWIRSIAFHPQEPILASAGNDDTVRIWNIYTGECIAKLEEHKDQVWSVAFSPNGQILASASDDFTVRLWDVNSYQCCHIFTEHTYWVRTVAFNAQGTILASASVDQTVKLWDVNTGECRTTWRQGNYPIRSIAFSPNGKILAIGSDDKMVRLLNIYTGECLKTFHGHDGRIWSVIFSPDGTILASGSADQTIKLWNIETGESFTLPERDAFGDRSYRRVRVIAFSPDGKTLISGSDDQSVRLWDVDKGKSLKTIYGHTQRVWSVTFSLDDKTLISGSDDGKISIWNIQTGKCKILGNHAKRVQSVAYTPQGKKIASGGNDGWVKLWDITTGKSVSLSEKHGDWIWLVSFNYDGTKLVSAGDDHSIKLWDTNTNQCWKSLNDYPYWIWSVAISPDSENIVIGSDAHILQLWNIATGKLTNIGEHQNRIRSVAWSPHGKIIASGSDDLTIKLWDISSGECLHILAGHNAQIRFLVFSPESKIVASASDDKIIRLWDVNTGQCLHKLQAHTKPVWSVAFSFDGKILASGSEDTTINLWDVQTGNCLQTLIPKKLYQDMNIAETQGLTEAQRDIIIGLGATNTYKN